MTSMPVLHDVATAQAQILLGAWQIFLICGLAIAAIVISLIFVCLFAWRRRDESFPPQFRKNTPLEISYTIVPLLIVAALFYVTLVREWAVEAQSPKPATTVHVTAYRWSWRFEYPREGVRIDGTPQNPPEFVLPLNQPARIELTSEDVNHAFWIPKFLFKRDAIAGFVNTFDLTPTRAGVYHGLCAEFCGLDHTMMTFSVRVLPPAQFRAWIASKRSVKR